MTWAGGASVVRWPPQCQHASRSVPRQVTSQSGHETVSFWGRSRAILAGWRWRLMDSDRTASPRGRWWMVPEQ